MVRLPLCARLVSHLLTAVVVATTSSQLRADIKFDDNPINFSAPSLIAPPGVANLVVTQAGTQTKLDNGFEISGLEFQVTALRGIPGFIGVRYSGVREFELTQNSDVIISIFGETTIIDTSTGPAIMRVDGAVVDKDGFDLGAVEYSSGEVIGNFSPSWNDHSERFSLTADTYPLSESMLVSWIPEAEGDTITVSSLYRVTITVVPELSTLSMAGAVLLTLVLTPRRSKIVSSMLRRGLTR
jgi:hypothetical protein